MLPELILLVAACAVVLVEPFLKADKTAVLVVALIGLVASGGVSLGLVGEERLAFAGMLVLDDWAVFFNVLFALAAALTILMSSRYLQAHGRHLGEYYALVLFAVIGMDLMAASRDFIAFYVALELMAISSYILAAFFRYRVRSNESSLKYFLTGSFASAIMLYGISLVYGYAGATNFQTVGQALAGASGSGTGASTGVLLAVFLVAVGLAFKVSAAPFHMWTPDVYQGAPTPVAAFFSVGPKAAAFSVILVAFIVAFPSAAKEWGVFFIVLSIVTMIVGNVFALVQTNVKRMLAYSSIAHAGYLLAGVGAMGWSARCLPGARSGDLPGGVHLHEPGRVRGAGLPEDSVAGQVRLFAQVYGWAGPTLSMGGGASVAVPALTRRHPRNRWFHRQVLRVRRRSSGPIWCGWR